MTKAADAIRQRIAGMMADHGLAVDAVDFDGDVLLECAVTELRWCLRKVEAAGEIVLELDCKGLAQAVSGWAPSESQRRFRP